VRGLKSSGQKKIPLLISGGDKEEAKMLTQNTKSAFEKQKTVKNFSIYSIQNLFYLSNIISYKSYNNSIKSLFF